MFAILFETLTFQGLDVQFKPSSQEEALQGKDTGYQLRGKYRAANKTGKLLYHKYSIKRKKSPFYKIACAEYYLPGCNKIFASHFWRGSSLVMSENISLNNHLILLLRKMPKIGGRVITKIRKRQKTKWLKICKEIVNNETD